MKYVCGYFTCQVGAIQARRKFEGIVKTMILTDGHYHIQGMAIPEGDIAMLVDTTQRKETKDIFKIPESSKIANTQSNVSSSALEDTYLQRMKSLEERAANYSKTLGSNDSARAILDDRISFVNALFNVSKKKKSQSDLPRCIRELEEVFSTYFNSLLT